MSDDIVTRLREWHPSGRECEEAADEIERLRTVGDRLAALAVANVPCSCRREWVCHRCQTLNDWKDAHDE